jgi:hypothetical protein
VSAAPRTQIEKNKNKNATQRTNNQEEEEEEDLPLDVLLRVFGRKAGGKRKLELVRLGGLDAAPLQPELGHVGDANRGLLACALMKQIVKPLP